MPFGGITVVFGGDFRQILPVKMKGSRETSVATSLQRSRLWRGIKILSLTENMRLSRNPEDVNYAEWLLNIGDGKLTAEDCSITLSANKKCGDTVQSLIDATCPGISHIVPSERA